MVTASRWNRKAVSRIFPDATLNCRPTSRIKSHVEEAEVSSVSIATGWKIWLCVRHDYYYYYYYYYIIIIIIWISLKVKVPKVKDSLEWLEVRIVDCNEASCSILRYGAIVWWKVVEQLRWWWWWLLLGLYLSAAEQGELLHALQSAIQTHLGRHWQAVDPGMSTRLTGDSLVHAMVHHSQPMQLISPTVGWLGLIGDGDAARPAVEPAMTEQSLKLAGTTHVYRLASAMSN